MNKELFVAKSKRARLTATCFNLALYLFWLDYKESTKLSFKPNHLKNNLAVSNLFILNYLLAKNQPIYFKSTNLQQCLEGVASYE